MPNRFLFSSLAGLLLLSLISCGGFEKVRKSSDVNLKLTKANEYFDKKDYLHANELYGDLKGIMKNTRNYEGLYYKYAYTYFYMKNYLEASYYFKNFTEIFPNSKLAEECEFMHGVSLFKFSPKYSLDQTNTYKALETLQSFINTHPKSDKLAEASSYVSQCRSKLETKDADAAKLYFNIGQYKASAIAYRSVMHNYPESALADYYQFMIMKSAYKYAELSVLEKQEERYSNAINAYHEFVDAYPHSRYLADAEKLFTQTESNLKKIRNEHK